MPSDNEDFSKKVKPASDGILDVSGLEVMLVLLNGSILLTVLLSLVFSIQHDLNYLESVAEVYKNVSADLVRFYGEEVRKSIRFLVYGVTLISFLTGYQIYLIRRASERYPRLTAIYAISTALIWSFLLICIFELILFPGRGELKPLAALPKDVAINIIKSLTNLDMFRHWFCEVIFSVETLVSLITLLYAVWIFKYEFKENAPFLLTIIILCVLSYYFLLTLPEVIVYRGPMEISSGIYWFERPPLIIITLPPKIKIISFRPDELSAFVKYWAGPLLASITVSIAVLKNKIKNNIKKIIKKIRDNWRYIVQKLIILAIIIGVVLKAVILPNKIDQNSVLYLSSAVLQAYAALIAIPFAIAAIHLQRKYGFISTQILFKRLKRIFSIFAVILFVSVLSIALSPNEFLLPYLLIAEIVVALAPIEFIINFIKGIMFLKPSEILQDIGYPDQPAELLKQGKVFEAWNILYQGFGLARSCLIDPALHDEANIVIGRLASALNKIDWTLEVREHGPTGSLDISGILFNILWILPTHIVEPIRTSTLKPNPLYIRSLMGAIARGYISSMKEGYPMDFDNFLEYIYKLVESYYEIDKNSAWDIFGNVLSIASSILKSCNKKKAKILEEYALPRILCCGLQICNMTYKKVLPKIMDFSGLESEPWLTIILDTLRKRPRMLFHMPCLESLKEAIKNSEMGICKVLILLALCNHEKSKLPKHMHKRAEYVIERLSKEILKILDKNGWKLGLIRDTFVIRGKNGTLEIVLPELKDENIRKVVEDYLHQLLRDKNSL